MGGCTYSVCVCVLLVQGTGDADAGLDAEHLQRKALKRKKKKKKATVYDVSDCQAICGNVWQTVALSALLHVCDCFCCFTVGMPRPTH